MNLTVRRRPVAAALAVAGAAVLLVGCGASASPSSAPSPSPAASQPMSRAGRGPVLRITVARGCPPTARGTVASTGPPGATALVPVAPTGGLACRYSGVGPKGQRLQQSAQLTAPPARRLATLLNELPTADGAIACPADSGARDILALAYPDRPDVDVEVGLSGCHPVSNGRISRLAGAALLDTLAALVGDSSRG